MAGNIHELREAISKLRDRLAATSKPHKDDVLKLEGLIQDLQALKQRNSWKEKIKQSEIQEDERKKNMGSKGKVEWFMDDIKKGNSEVQEKVVKLQKERDHVALQYKDERKVVDDLKEELQMKIMEYSKYSETGNSSESNVKKMVNGIHSVKEKLKQKTDRLKDLKEQLRILQEKQDEQREGVKSQMAALKGIGDVRKKVEQEEREQMEKEHQLMINRELEQSKLQMETAKAEIQVRVAEGKTYTPKEGADLEMQLAELKSSKSVAALQLQLMQQEKQHLLDELSSLYTVQEEELQMQQYQHLQTFRQYREVFEVQKSAIIQRYHKLLEDSIQDAIYLSSRNSDLEQDNKDLKKQIDEITDSLTKRGLSLPEVGHSNA